MAIGDIDVSSFGRDDGGDADMAAAAPASSPPPPPWSAAADSLVAKAGRAADACDGRLWAQLPARCGLGGLTVMPHEWPALVAACRGGLVLDLTACTGDAATAAVACDILALAVGSGVAGLALPAPEAAPCLWNVLHRLTETSLTAAAPTPLANRIAVALAKEKTAGAAFV
jgi:hypothetical protein